MIAMISTMDHPLYNFRLEYHKGKMVDIEWLRGYTKMRLNRHIRKIEKNGWEVIIMEEEEIGKDISE